MPSDNPYGLHEPLIEVANGQVKVKTMQISMSRVHKIAMLIDLFTIIIVCFVAPIALSGQETLFWKIIVGCIFALALVCGIGKILCDFGNWFFTMNRMLDSMGERYVKDVSAIVGDFINAGLKLCDEELKKATVVSNANEVQPEASKAQAE